MQAVRVAAEAKSEAMRHEMFVTTFGAWQTVRAWGGEKVPAFAKYARAHGVMPKEEAPPEEVIAAEKARAEENARKAIEAFSTP